MISQKLFGALIALLVISYIVVADTPKEAPSSSQILETKKIKVNDVEIAYYLRGTGKPLLMFNGFKGTVATWDPALLERLEKKYQLILFDRRGIGQSTDAKNTPFTIKQMADDGAALIKALGFTKVNALGWSMGARVGQQFGLRHSDILEKLILCSPHPGEKYRVTASWKVAQSVHSPTISLEQMLDMQFPQTTLGKTSELAYKTRIYQAISDGKAPRDLEIAPEYLKREQEALELWNKSDDNYESLSKIRVPTLLCGGKEDVIDPPENVRLLANRIPFAWTAYFEGGHAFLFQDYDRFADLVMLFLE